MNEVKKCSLSGISFMLESDAYAMLKEYVETLEKSYGKQPEGSEIVADIEARIAELILSTQDNARVVERPLIANIIAQLGSAEAISEESSTDDETPVHEEPRIPRRLYRDMENARLGGVCSGIAKYFDKDPSWVRLATVSPLLIVSLSLLPHMLYLQNVGFSLFCVSLLSYLVMWFAVPAARSPRQKLEASGQRITVQSIRSTSAGAAANDVDRKARPVVAETVTVFGRLLIIVLKLLGCVAVFGLTIAAVALIIGIFAVVGCDMTGMGDFVPWGPLEILRHTNSVAVMGILLVLIPDMLLLYVLICLLARTRVRRSIMLGLFLLWIVILVALPFTAVRRANAGREKFNYTYENSETLERHEYLLDSIENAAEQYEWIE